MYLYDNANADALARLQGLERIDDDLTVAALERLPRLEGLNCLEVGAGAGSIAAWLAAHVGASGKVLATDIDPAHLDNSKYDVLRHDIQRDPLPTEVFDLVHLRHVLVHLSDPASALAKIRNSMKCGGHLVVEESDLRSWAPVTRHLTTDFQKVIDAVLELYAARGMNVAMGAELPELLSGAGYLVLHQREARRTVTGGSAEAAYQELSTRQLALSVAKDNSEASRILASFAPSFRDPTFQYISRTTVSVSAQREL